jgi:hypothetical protein
METFSHVIRMASLRLFLAIAAARDLELCQFEIATAFLYAPIKEDVYVRQPLGFTDGTSKVCRLKRAYADLNDIVSCVAQSTCEAEYYSLADATKEGLHLRQLMGEIFNAPILETTTIWEDNQSAIAYSQNSLVNEKTKHIGLKWHFLKVHVD